MSVKINDVLSHLKTFAATLPGMSAERVHIGPIMLGAVGLGTQIIINELREPAVRKDDDKFDRMVHLEIGVAMPVDPTSTTDIDLQINAIYQPLHAGLEAKRDGVAGLFDTMEEDSEGPSSEIVWEQIPIRIKSCSWVVRFDRTLGQTD